MWGNSSIRRLLLAALCGFVCLSLAVSGFAKTAKSTAKTSSPTAKSSSGKKKSSKSKSRKSSRKRGQKAIDGERVQQIQEALIRENYLHGTPSGKWDDATQTALRKYQGDNGWQNKTVPDSRALIKLGLGPNHDHLLNPETAMTTQITTDHKTATKAAPSAPAGDPPANGTKPQR